MKLDDAAAHLEALGNPTRLKIYRTLVRAGESGLPVGELQDRLKIAPSTLSHHIKTLVTVGIVTQVREATTIRAIGASTRAYCWPKDVIYRESTSQHCSSTACRVLMLYGPESSDVCRRAALLC